MHCAVNPVIRFSVGLVWGVAVDRIDISSFGIEIGVYVDLFANRLLSLRNQSFSLVQET